MLTPAGRDNSGVRSVDTKVVFCENKKEIRKDVITITSILFMSN